MQQRLLQQPRGGRLGQAGFLRQARADHRAHALGRQFEDLHVHRPGRLGEPEHGVQAGTTRIELALAGGQLQAQVGEGTVELVQPRDEPARQQAAGYAEDERGLGGLPAQLGTDATQSLERIAAGVTQANAGIGEFTPRPSLPNRATPRSSSSNRTCRLTAPWVTCSSSAARLMLCNRAAASKARRAFREGRSRLMAIREFS